MRWGRLTCLGLVAALSVVGPPAVADLDVRPESDVRNDADNAAEKAAAKDSFDKAVKDASEKSSAFKTLIEKIQNDHSVSVVIHVRKDKSPEVDSALTWNALGVTDLNMTNVLRFPNPAVVKCGDKPTIQMPDGFPPWAMTRTEILYHVLDEAYHGAQDAAAKKLTGKESDYASRLASRLETNHETAIKEQAAVRKDFGQTYTVYGQLTGNNGQPLSAIQVGAAAHAPKVKFTFLTPDKHGTDKASYLWFEDGLLHFGFYSGTKITEPTIPDGGFAMSGGAGPEDQAQYAALCEETQTEEVTTPAAATSMSVFESAVLDGVNFAREHPQDYARLLAAGPQTAARREAIAYLDGLSPLPPLAASPPLEDAARQEAEDAGQHGLTGHAGSDGSTATQRMQRAGVFASVFAEEISFGQRNADAVVRQLVIDEDNPRRTHRTDLFDGLLRQGGVGCGPHATMGEICVIDLTSAPLPR